MARNPSAMKYKRQSEARRVRNRAYKSMVRTFTKKALQAAEDGDMDSAREYQRVVTSTIDKATKGSTYHPNTANRKKSRLAQAIKRIDLGREAQA